MFNHGNTCFLNSTLQCLVHTPPLAQILLNDPLAIRGFSTQENQNIAILLLFKRFIFFFMFILLMLYHILILFYILYFIF